MVEFAELSEVKDFFNVEDDEIDGLLQTTITHYSTTITNETGLIEESHELKELLFAAVGCHLTRINIEKILPTLAYTIGSVKERFQTPATADNSWCQEYNERLNDIKSTLQSTRLVVGKRRKGIRDLSEFSNPY